MGRFPLPVNNEFPQHSDPGASACSSSGRGVGGEYKVYRNKLHSKSFMLLSPWNSRAASFISKALLRTFIGLKLATLNHQPLEHMTTLPPPVLRIPLLMRNLWLMIQNECLRYSASFRNFPRKYEPPCVSSSSDGVPLIIQLCECFGDSCGAHLRIITIIIITPVTARRTLEDKSFLFRELFCTFNKLFTPPHLLLVGNKESFSFVRDQSDENRDDTVLC